MSTSCFALAKYKVTGVPHYDGNPLIECLPAILSDAEVVHCVGNIPPRPDRSEIELPAKIRGHGINRLKEVVIPFDIHLRLEDIFSQLIRYGYVGRHPFAAATLRSRIPSAIQVERIGFKSTSDTMTLIGLSGMGKTTALNAIAKNYPQVISHTKYKRRIFIQVQVVWLKIECPHDGSLKGFCAAFYSSLDSALGITKYSVRGGNRSISVMLQDISQLCKAFFIGALIIDEMQHLNSSRGGRDREKLLNFFVTLSNDAGVPLVYVGTNAMLPLFSGVLRNARRAAGIDQITFDRFDESDPFWDHLVSQLWSYDWTGKNTPLNDDLRKKIYYLTQGNTDFLVKLLMLAQRHVISEGLESVTVRVLDQVYHSQLRLLHKPIEALRSGDPLQIADFEDMMPTKDQVESMMNYDLARRARRADLSLISQIAPAAVRSPSEKRERNTLVPVSGTSKGTILQDGADVQAELSDLGWVNKDAPW